jgi:hypothetical protein
MFKFVTANAIAAVVAAALVASLAVVLTSMVPEAKAETLVQAPLSQFHAVVKANTIVKEPACLLQGWPHYEQSCQFDLRAPASETRTVRVIALR